MMSLQGGVMRTRKVVIMSCGNSEQLIASLFTRLLD
jgi:hypothetical protein